jgi:chromosome segregation ATPase
VDTERQKQLEQTIVAARAEIDSEEARMGEINARDQPLRNAISELEDQVVGIYSQRMHLILNVICRTS